MPDFSKRSPKTELLDENDIPFADIRQNMAELDTINRLLGGHQVTINGFKAFNPDSKSKLTICEIGCGGGDNLRAIFAFAKSKNMQVSLIGIDIKEECIAYARQKNKDLPATWVCSDFALAPLEALQPDIIFSSLFCHHFTNEQLVEVIRWMHRHSRLGFFINDLQRHPVAWASITLLTKLFSRSYLVKNDAPISVERGFRKKDWQQILSQAGLQHCSIQWKWAFRYLVICKK